MARVVDYTPLTTLPNRADVAAWRASARSSGAAWAALPLGQVVGLAVGGVAFVLLAVPFIGTFVVAVARAISSPIAIGMVAFFVVVIVSVIAVVVVAIARGGGRWARWVRIDRFARANGMRFSPADPDPAYPGAIFGQGGSRTALEHLTTVEGRFLDFGNYRYVTGSGKNRTEHTWGFVALQLDRRVPHMVLDSRANNGLFGGTNLPAVFDRDQVLALEGDFGEHFTLYCPREYERDALYVFTPDLMALLIDNAAPFDVEVIDSWLFVYSARPFDPTDPATYERIFRIVDTVGSKAVTQTDRYADERVGDRTLDVVAPQGARLKRGILVGAILIMAAFAIIWVVSIVSDAIDTFTP